CHVKAGCTNYLIECRDCPVISFAPAKSTVHKRFMKKGQLFSCGKINIVTPSAWLANEIKKSNITKESPIQNIANPIDIALFKPLEHNSSAHDLRVLIGFMKINAAGHKGFEYAMEALRIFKQKNPEKNLFVEIFG